MEKSALAIRSGILLAVIAAVSLTQPLGLAQQPPTKPAPRRGILVLKSGNVLEGMVQSQGDRYLVAIPGGQIYVRASEADFFSPSLEEAYLHRRSLIPRGSTDDHVKLAQWCLRWKLIQPAAEQLAEAKRLDPDHPLIPLLERRLTSALWKPRNLAPRAKPARPAPSSEELDRLVRELPPQAVERFTQKIQPLLANRCSTALCHGAPSENPFRLLRIPSKRPPSRRLTQRNLHGVLQWIDRRSPGSSPLLSAPIGPHGTAQEALWNEETDQYRELASWVYLVAQQPIPETENREPADIPEANAPAVERLPEGLGQLPKAVASRVVDPGNPSADEAFSAKGLTNTTLADLPLSNPSNSPNAFDTRDLPDLRVRRGASIPRLLPADPFDPSIFNRRYHPHAPARSSALP